VRLVLRILGNSLALYAAAMAVSGFIIVGNWREYLIAGTTLGLLNTVLKPLLKGISFPIIILTLGLFLLVINAFLISLVAYIFPFITITDVFALIAATVIVALVNFFVSISAKII